MPDEEQKPTAPPDDDAPGLPDDFAAYKAARRGGDTEKPPQAQEIEAPSAAPADKPEAETAAESDAAETGQEREEEEEGDEREPERRSRRSRRIDRLTREKRDLEAHNRELAARLAALEPKPAAEKPEVEPKPTDGKPRVEDYPDSYEDFVEALTDWKADQRDRERDRKDSERQQETERKRQELDWAGKIAGAKKRYRDFDDVTEAADITLSPAMRDAIVDSPQGGDLVYYLAQHPEEASAIAQASPLAAAREIGKLEAKLAQQNDKPAPQPKTISAAPKPVTPVGGRAAAEPDVLNEEFAKDFSAWRKARQKQLAR